MHNTNRRLANNYSSLPEALFHSAERLSIEELRRRTNIYEDRQRLMRETKGIKGILLRFLGLPIILDNVNPLHRAEDIYTVAKYVLEDKLSQR